MISLLKNKNILVAVTGSIAIYKTLELIRLYVKAGAKVKVIMTNGAKKFINPLTFETISQNKVLDDENEDWSTDTVYNHIAIGKWADILVIAPATVNTINKLSQGRGDNILLQTVLAYPHIKLLSPAANTNMIKNPLTQDSLKRLQLCNFKLINTTTKELACKDIGDGAMAEVSDIFDVTCRELLKDNYWIDRKVILNGGGTIEKIDDVRYISNFSSGKMASSLAKALFYKGAQVTLITTSDANLTKDINVIYVKSTKEMQKSINKNIKIAKNKDAKNLEKKPYFFAVAAVSDYVPEIVQKGKIKKSDIGKMWDLKLTKNIDILDKLNKKNIYTIGFKAEMDVENAKKNAMSMLLSKKIDGVCLNILNDENSFGSEKNKITFINKNNSFELPEKTKFELSLLLLDTLKGQYSE